LPVVDKHVVGLRARRGRPWRRVIGEEFALYKEEQARRKAA